MPADFENLLNTLAWTVRRMRDLQRTVEGGANVEYIRLMRAAELEVDQLVELHCMPPLPTTLPFLAPLPEGGDK